MCPRLFGGGALPLRGITPEFMDRNDTIRNLLIAVAVFLGVMSVAPLLLGPPRSSPATTPGTTEEPPAGASGLDRPAVGAGGTQPAPTAESASPGKSASWSAVEADGVAVIALGAEPVATDAESFDPHQEPYRMRLELSNIGASVERALLTDHAESLSGMGRYQLLAPLESGGGATWRSLAVERVAVNGEEVLLLDKRWQAEPVREFRETGADGKTLEGSRAEFWIDVVSPAGPAVRVRREYRLAKQPPQDLRSDVFSTITVENLSTEAHEVRVVLLGGVGVRKTDPRVDDRFVDVGIDPGEGEVAGKRVRDADVSRQEGRQYSLFAPDPAARQKRLSWVATNNQYFTCTLAPVTPGTDQPTVQIAAAAAVDLDGLAESTEDVSVRLATAPERLEPAGNTTLAAELYIGGKEPRSFRKVEEYNERNYYFQISQGFGWCTFNWLVELMIWLLDGLHLAVRDYGVAIIILVLVVRTLLHPITKKGQVNMVRMQHRMQELAPKIEEIKKKYANDKARMQQEMMKLDLNPAGQMLTCLPMVLQMPIWIALYLSLSNNIAMRHEPLHFTWIRDLTAQDALVSFSSPLHLPIFGAIEGFNLLPLLLAIAMYVNQKLMPQPKPSPNMTEQQRAQQEMMKNMGPIMSVMMFLVLYKAPSGLNLYIMASSIFGTIEQHRIRKHIREREEAGTLHGPKQPAPKSNSGRKWFEFAWWERLKAMADDARKEQLRRVDKRPRR